MAGELVSRDCAMISGWVLDSAGPVRSVLLAIDGIISASVIPRLPRSDLAGDFKGLPQILTCGWEIALDLRHLAPGVHVVAAIALSASGDACEVARVDVAVPKDAAGTRRPLAVFTIVQDEPVFLPLWLDYYSRHVEAADIFVLDHGGHQSGQRTLPGRCNIVPVHRAVSFDHHWLLATVQDFQSMLLRSYEAVVFCEVDEWILPHPARYRNLAEYAGRMTGPAARCTGFNVIHDPQEPPVDLERPLLAQRAKWHPAPRYSKTLIARKPLRWVAGFHETLGEPPLAPDPDLVLAHLHRLDVDLCRARHESSAKRRWSERDLLLDYGKQNRIVEHGEFSTWFYQDPELTAFPAENIPAWAREMT